MLETINDYIKVDLTHSLHTSESKSFRGCRRRWNWLFRNYLYPKTTVKPLEFGSAYHKGCEVLYSPKLWDTDEETVISLAKTAFAEMCQEQKEKYEEEYGHDPEVDADYKERVELGNGMLDYFAKHSRRVDKAAGFTPTYVEVSFELPIEGPNGEQLWCKCDNCWARYVAYARTLYPDLAYSRIHQEWKGLPVTYGGRLDAILEGPDGRIWIVDWKSARTLSTDREEFLLLDDQISRYCWALWKLGWRVAGFIYHEQKKGFPQEPEPLNRRYKGMIFSTNKQQDVEYDQYRNTVKELDPEAFEEGLYNPYLEYLQENPSRFSARYMIYRSEIELEQVGITIYDEACDMVDPALKIYPNAGRFNCTNCVDEETEILTQRGWLTYDKVCEDDIALTINPDTRLSEWQPVEHVHRYTGTFNMLAIEHRLHSSLSTLDHRWLVQSRFSNGKRPWKFSTTENLSTVHTIPGAAPCITLPTVPKYSDAFVELVAWYWTEGTCRVEGDGLISQSSSVYPENCVRIRAALEGVIPGKWNEWYNDKVGANRFWFGVATMREIGAVVTDHKPGKVISYEFVNSLTKAQLQLFLDVSCLADGYGEVYLITSQKRTTRGIGQRSRASLEPIQMVCALLGIRTHLYQRPDTQWILSFIDRTQVNLLRAHRRGEPIQHVGTVWCVTTQNSTWYARRNGHTYFTGNCAFRQPCLGMNMGEDYQYTLDTMFDKRQYHYWRIKKPSTESKGNE